jgi:hypothetical protein
MALRIPDRDKDRLAALIKLDPTTLDVLYDELKDRPPRLRVSELVSDIKEHVQVPQKTLGDVLSLLLTLYGIKADQEFSAERLVDELFRAMEESGDERLAPPSGGWETIHGRLTRLLSLERSLGVTSKALFIAYQLPCHLHSSRVLTDARPVYTPNPSEPPAAFIINHTLKLQVHDDGEDHDWFLSLNTEDLETLKKVIDRALEKEKSLKGLMAKTGVPILEWREDVEHGN